MLEKQTKSSKILITSLVIIIVVLSLVGIITIGFSNESSSSVNEIETQSTLEALSSVEEATSEESSLEENLQTSESIVSTEEPIVEPLDTLFNVQNNNDVSYEQLNNTDFILYDGYLYEEKASTNWLISGYIEVEQQFCVDANTFMIGTKFNDNRTITVDFNASDTVVSIRTSRNFVNETLPYGIEDDWTKTSFVFIRHNTTYYLSIDNSDYLIFEDLNELEESTPFLYFFCELESEEGFDIKTTIKNLTCIHDEEYIKTHYLNNETM